MPIVKLIFSSFPNANWLSLRIMIGIQWSKRWWMISWLKVLSLFLLWMKKFRMRMTCLVQNSFWSRSYLHVKSGWKMVSLGNLMSWYLALYVMHGMLLEGLVRFQWKIIWLEGKTEFMWHTIFQGLGERSRPMICVDQHVITTHVGSTKSWSTEKMCFQVVLTCC